MNLAIFASSLVFIAATVVAPLAHCVESTGAAFARCRFGEISPPMHGEITTTEQSTATHRLAVYYAVPTNVPYDQRVYRRIIDATVNIVAWYQCAATGKTWEYAFPETVRVFYGLQTREYYKDNGDWWGSLLPEMGSRGQPIWTSNYVCTIWAHGAGWWAGAAQFCGVDCGTALLGVEVLPEFNNPAYSGGNCPGGTGVGAWPCTPEGAYAHELGHTLGLPHPADVPATSAVASHSVMQTHWNYPTFAPPSETPWGFLTLERQTIASNPFMVADIPLSQTHACDVVNLPTSGALPVAGFSASAGMNPFAYAFTNASTNASSYYWTFGDQSHAGAVSPNHIYATPGYYTVLLRATNASAMVDTAALTVGVALVGVDPMERANRLGQSVPNPARNQLRITYVLERPGLVDLSVFGVDGRRLATLATGFRPAGTFEAEWAGQGEDGRRLSPGVYWYRLTAGAARATRRLVLID